MTLPQRQKVLTIDKQELHYQKNKTKQKKPPNSKIQLDSVLLWLFRHAITEAFQP